MRDWRIIGRCHTGELRLLALGDSREEVVDRLPGSLAALGQAEVRDLESGVIERFEAERLDGMGVPIGQWRPVDAITLGPHWLRRLDDERQVGNSGPDCDGLPGPDFGDPLRAAADQGPGP